jgi:DNA-binding FadR family transcriptional regulator
MVEVRTRTGIHIRSKSEWNLLDLDLLLWQCEVGVDEKFARNLCQIRQLLEPWAAETAALQATDQEIESLCHAYDKMVQSEGLGEDKAYDDADIEFHRAIGRASHNDFLVRINDNIFAAMGFISGVLKQRGQQMTSAAITQHGAVAEAIRKRNPEEARAAMVELVKYAEQSAYAAIRRELPERSALKPGQDSNVSGF